MGEINDESERLFWTKHSLEIATDLTERMQSVVNVLKSDPRCVDSDVYVKLRHLETGIVDLFESVVIK